MLRNSVYPMYKHILLVACAALILAMTPHADAQHTQQADAQEPGLSAPPSDSVF